MSIAYMAKTRSSEAEVINFVKDLYKGIRRFGLMRIEAKLQELYMSDASSVNEVLKKKIFDEISSAYGIPAHTIIRSKKRGAITQAKVIAIILLHRHLCITQAEIAEMFDRGETLISRRIKVFKSASAGDPIPDSERMFEKMYSSKDFMEKFNKINNSIIVLKESWKQKNQKTNGAA